MEWISGNIFIRAMGGAEGLQPGAVIEGHTHHFDHTTICFCGRWHVRKWLAREDNRLFSDFEREGPFHLLIEAEAKHEFTFLGPGVGHAWCVYSHRTPQGEISQVYTGWEYAYNAAKRDRNQPASLIIKT
jgi:hypothetical protein